MGLDFPTPERAHVVPSAEADRRRVMGEYEECGDKRRDEGMGDDADEDAERPLAPILLVAVVHRRGEIRCGRETLSGAEVHAGADGRRIDGERRLPQDLVERDGRPVDVEPRRGGCTVRLLGRGVAGRVGHLLGRSVWDDAPRGTEVEDPGASVEEAEVDPLDVPVAVSVGLHRHQPVREVVDEPKRLPDAHAVRDGFAAPHDDAGLAAEGARAEELRSPFAGDAFAEADDLPVEGLRGALPVGTQDLDDAVAEGRTGLVHRIDDARAALLDEIAERPLRSADADLRPARNDLVQWNDSFHNDYISVWMNADVFDVREIWRKPLCLQRSRTSYPVGDSFCVKLRRDLRHKRFSPRLRTRSVLKATRHFANEI